jgi:hypothetical protein
LKAFQSFRQVGRPLVCCCCSPTNKYSPIFFSRAGSPRLLPFLATSGAPDLGEKPSLPPPTIPQDDALADAFAQADGRGSVFDRR